MKRFIITKYTHGFRIRLLYTNDKPILFRFSHKLAVFDKVWSPELKRHITKPMAIYATASIDRMEYGFVRGELDYLLDHLRREGVNSGDIEIREQPLYTPETIDVSLMEGVGPRDTEQEDALEFLLEEGKRDRIVDLRTGGGKGHPLSTLVRTPNQWTAVGDLKVGDYVLAPNGTYTRVTGLFDRGKQPVFKFTFADGRATVVDVDHRWCVYRDQKIDSPSEVLSTAEIIKRLSGGTRERLYIPLTQPEPTPESEVLVRAYDMGYSVSQGVLASVPYYNQNVARHYLNGSETQRWRFLNGVLDSNGILEGPDTVLYETRCKPLVEDLRTLIYSLGGIVYVKESRPGFYQLRIQHPTPYRLFDQRLGVGQMKLPEGETLRLEIKSVLYQGEEETRCISVAHPSSLYVIHDYLVTHNTALGLMTIGHKKVRTVLLMSSRYIPIWMASIGWVLGLTENDVWVVRGSEALRKLIVSAKAGELDKPLIFISISTMRNYIKEYLRTEEGIEGVTPTELWEVLGAGIRIIDEAHENPHALALLNIHTHLPLSLYLSGSLTSDDPFINKQYQKMFPDADRFTKGRTNQHAEVYNLKYRLSDSTKIKYMGHKGYSHVAFEQSLMKKTRAFKSYYQLILDTLLTYYVESYKPGQKALIFCATTACCYSVAQRLIEDLREYGLLVSDFVASHAEEVLHEHDVVVTTPTSAGTGKDIKDLAVCISTVALSSTQRNIQMLGRLRPMKSYPDISPKYIYLTCTNIEKHLQYDHKRKEVFRIRSKSITDVESHYTVQV